MFSSKRWRTPSSKRKEGTTLTEVTVHHIRDAHAVTGLQPEGYTPVTLVPARSASSVCCVPCCWVSIPNGFSAMVTRWGKDVEGDEPDGTWSKGFHCFWPWYRVARLVTTQLTVFDTPVKGCKTKDNITVHIDVLIVFEIENAVTFTYAIGPEKFDDVLRASQEEVLRQMASEICVDRVCDLFGTTTDHHVEKMNKAFIEQYGVRIHHFTIRNVSIPPAMAKDFEDKTLYESKTVEAEMMQESNKLKLNNEEARQKLSEECDNARMAVEEQSITQKAQITKEVREVIASTAKAVMVLEAQRKAAVEDVETTGALEIAKIQAQASTLKKDTLAKTEAEEGKLEAAAEAYQKRKHSTSQVEASQKICIGRKATAEAEGQASSAFKAKRAQEQELKRLEILDRLANNKDIHIVTSLENNTGLAPGNSLVNQVMQQGMEALRMKLAEATAVSATNLGAGKMHAGGLIRPVPAQMQMK